MYQSDWKQTRSCESDQNAAAKLWHNGTRISRAFATKTMARNQQQQGSDRNAKQRGSVAVVVEMSGK